jgi:hypothetical protein
MHQAGPGSRPFVLATLRALRLDPGPYPALPTRRPKASKPLVDNVLTEPRPFRDDIQHHPRDIGVGLDRLDHESVIHGIERNPDLLPASRTSRRR